MENFDNNVQGEHSFINSTEITNYLMETAKWGKFLAIVGYVSIGLLGLLAIFMMVGLSAMSDFSGTEFPVGAFGFIYIIMGAMYYFPVTYLYKYAVQIKKGLKSNDITTITAGFQNLKSLFKFMAIVTIVILSIYGLMLLVAVPTMLYFKPYR
jgi:hypothetical protein